MNDVLPRGDVVLGGCLAARRCGGPWIRVAIRLMSPTANDAARESAHSDQHLVDLPVMPAIDHLRQGNCAIREFRHPANEKRPAVGNSKVLLVAPPHGVERVVDATYDWKPEAQRR